MIVGLVGLGLLTVALLTARRERGVTPQTPRTASRVLAMARQGLAVLRAPAAAVGAICLQIAGWTLQLLAVWAVTEAFDLDVPLPAAALVLLLMNIATVFPLWPGNIGLLQAAVALPLVQYGVSYGTGFAYGLVLQAIEMSVGVGVGLAMLANEGLSLAALKRMEDDEETSAEDVLDARGAGRAGGRARTRRRRLRHTGSFPALNAPSRAAMRVSASAELGACPVTAATKGSRSSATSSTSVTAVAVAGAPRRGGGRSPERLAVAEAPAEDLDLARIDDVEAIARVALPHDRVAAPKATDVASRARRSSTGSGRAARIGTPRSSAVAPGAPVVRSSARKVGRVTSASTGSSTPVTTSAAPCRPSRSVAVRGSIRGRARRAAARPAHRARGPARRRARRAA